MIFLKFFKTKLEKILGNAHKCYCCIMKEVIEATYYQKGVGNLLFCDPGSLKLC